MIMQNEEGAVLIPPKPKGSLANTLIDLYKSSYYTENESNNHLIYCISLFWSKKLVSAYFLVIKKMIVILKKFLTLTCKSMNKIIWII